MQRDCRRYQPIMFEPPRQPDDTQPAQTRSTSPRRPRQRRDLSRAMLLVLIVCTGFSLLVTIGFAVSRYLIPPMPDEQRATVLLVVDGEQRTVETSAATVRDFLREQRVSIDRLDAVSMAMDRLIEEDITITVARARSVRLRLNDEWRTLRTPLTNPYDILQSQQITVKEGDRIFVDGTPATPNDLIIWPVAASEIVVDHTVLVEIEDGNAIRTLRTTAETVGAVLDEADIPLYLTDQVQPDTTTAVREGLRIVIDRARPVQIVVDGTTLDTRVQGATVADVLSEAGIALVGYDYAVPPQTTLIEANMTVYVVRVREDIESDNETIPFETVFQANDALELDQRQVVQAGVQGIRRYDERVRYENDVEIGREPAGSVLVQEPRNQIIQYGTKVVIRTVNTPQGPREYWRMFRMYATSYHPEALGGDDVTAIGETLRTGIVAADPDIIPYRLNVFVPGYGVGMMADTGGPRSSPYWIDLGYSDADWVSWSRYVDVYVLTPVPATIDYLLPAYRPLRSVVDDDP